MCGIAGIFLHKKNVSINEHVTQVEKILQQQIFRGPDFQTIEKIESQNQFLILGHNRLSIVDLHSNSNQPMWDESKRYCIAYNGMLYNYLELREKLETYGVTFFSAGDTEVVLKSFMYWGMAAFEHFNGMFAIVIYDSLEEKLYFVRDRFGVKPLFYCHHADKIYFASTSAELARQLNLQPNFNILANGINYWCYDSQTNSVYENLLMVAPGEVIEFHHKNGLNISARKFYSLSDRINELTTNQSKASQYETIDKVEYLLSDAIKIRLRSDVPLGISLSGGVDSASVASFAKKQLPHLTAFSFGSLDNYRSEAKMTMLSAKKSMLDLQFVTPTMAQMQDGFWETLLLQDAPFPNFSVVAQYFVFKEARQKDFKVMLGGQGGDEIFMGYRKYFIFYLQRLLQQKKYFSAFNFFSYLMPTLCLEAGNFKSHLFNIKRYFKPIKSSNCFNSSSKIQLGINANEPLWMRQHHDIYTSSLPTLLRYEDRNSMGNSIESRLPFLDYRLVELALSLPESLKLHRGYTKWILRKISENNIPNEICFSRRKRGFDVQTQHWIFAGIGKNMREAIKSNAKMLKTLNISHKIDTLFSDQQLIQNQTALVECITLTWLASKNHFIWN